MNNTNSHNIYPFLCDSHLHFNAKAANPLEDLKKYLGNSISFGTLILNTSDEYNFFRKSYEIDPEIFDNLFIVFGLNKNDFFIKEANEFAKNYKLKCGIKIHSRLFRINFSQLEWYFEEVKRYNPRVVVVDDFVYGNDVEEELNITLACGLAEKLPDSKIILAHSGGAMLLNHVMRTKVYSNIFYDLSLTINYMAGSSIDMDIQWMIRFMHSRTMLGSDYPDFTNEKAYQRLKELTSNKDFGKIVIDDLCVNTYRKVYLE
ncbi:hypothetical protein D081_0250 [Anaerovibrio sp. JC8]|uniref:amidohydrolase family protein n=1 Tax=Anaerovibrio sp. JC8 TaxID=1240085 RepID=UPI000A0D531F|nr:amidohydrolase family protein [Anaerovibrio sp. JC8]ORU01431.1 hypothetical protein D081_0250 [Anaerovibrio sp. JC8]